MAFQASNFALLGGFRSGTTLLINILGLSEQIVPWYETKELCELFRWISIIKGDSTEKFESGLIKPPEISGFNLNAVYQRMSFHIEWTEQRIKGIQKDHKKSYEKYPIGSDCIVYTIDESRALLDEWHHTLQASKSIQDDIFSASRLLISKLLELQFLNKMNANFCVNKTPEITRFSHIIADYTPVKSILLLRDPRFVVQSGIDLQWGSIDNLFFMWKKLIQLSRQSAMHNCVDYMEVRFEDLITIPQSTLERIFSFLEIDTNAYELLQKYPVKLDCDRLNSKLLNSKVSKRIEQLDKDFIIQMGY
ncbi:MAG: sulfotransferase [gamma proteobacterium symbiont of Taylorina sp.]|nr:sulfotransferase [gamma proteobacterium symbiont of Taylorina sp.]